jgi:hypothetical protein
LTQKATVEIATPKWTTALRRDKPRRTLLTIFRRTCNGRRWLLTHHKYSFCKNKTRTKTFIITNCTDSCWDFTVPTLAETWLLFSSMAGGNEAQRSDHFDLPKNRAFTFIIRICNYSVA